MTPPAFQFSKNIPQGQPLSAIVYAGGPQGKELVWSMAAQAFSLEILKNAREDGALTQAEEALFSRPQDRKPAHRLLLLSGGKKADATLHTLRRLAAVAYHKAAKARLKEAAFLLPGDRGTLEEEAQAVVEGFVLGSYRFNRHKSAVNSDDSLKSITLVAKVTIEGKGLSQAMERGLQIGRAVNFAKDLINEPPSLKRPQVLGKVAQTLSGRGVTVKVFHKNQIEKMKMNALLGVNAGSEHPPVFLHLHYKGPGKPFRRLALVGKGITFDSGGLSLKTADGMTHMKYDMTGAASMLAVFQALKSLRPGIEVHGLAPITENMPGGNAYKPGDVVKAMNGKTIEVLNTDAEGRVVLADALSYASRLPVDEIIDIATLTGAAVIALGKGYAGLMGNDDALCSRLSACAKEAGEKVWALPLETSYKDHIKSKVADLKNIGNPGEAGTIIGGLFLQEFVEGKKWAHLDIASCAWNADDAIFGTPGAAGVMIRTLMCYFLSLGKNG